MSIDQTVKALGGIKNAIDLVSKIGTLATKSATLELQENLIVLREELVTIKESLIEIKEENLELSEENKKLKSETPKLELEKKGKLYYIKGVEDPVCYNCSTKESRPLIISQIHPYKYECKICAYSVILGSDRAQQIRIY